MQDIIWDLYSLKCFRFGIQKEKIRNRNIHGELNTVAHVCNPSSVGSEKQDSHKSRSDLGKRWQYTISTGVLWCPPVIPVMWKPKGKRSWSRMTQDKNIGDFTRKVFKSNGERTWFK
jgi:hypothetical protein